MTASSMSIAIRALLALALMIGFYGLAIGIVFGLLYLPYAEVVYLNRLHPQLVALAVVGAVVILAAIIPRRDRFASPGPRLTADAQPALFELIRNVASVTLQKTPREVYLIWEVNAWVASRGGTIGIGGRRVMAVGLPLLSVLTVSELRAVLAHEFGHFHGGDTRLGRWVYQTSAALIRTVQSLEEGGSILQVPFVLYARLFLRVSRAVSRHQELAADRLSAETIGAQALAGGLTKVNGAGLAFGAYWSTEIASVVNAGYRPPLADGFRRFVSGSLGAPAIQAAVQRALEHPDRHAYDSHPPLVDRLKALRKFGDADEPSDDRPALSLLRDIDALERIFLERATSSGQPLRPVAWEAVGQTVYPTLWERSVLAHSGLTAVRTIGDLADHGAEAVAAIALLAAWHGPPRSDDERRGYAVWILGAALAAALSRAGWAVQALPGETLALSGPGWTLDPFEVASALTSGKLDGAEWRRQCEACAVAEVGLWPEALHAVKEAATARELRQTGGVMVAPQSRPAEVTPSCWQCKASLPARAELRGKKVSCPQCGTKQRLPT
jgi:Zn-dependent protease with chaperone function